MNGTCQYSVFLLYLPRGMVTYTFLALAVPTVLGLAADLTTFCPPLFLASFSALTLSSAYVLSMVDVLRISTSRRVEETFLKKWGTKCFSKPGLDDCFLINSVKMALENCSQSSFEDGLADFSFDSASVSGHADKEQ